MQKEKDKMAKRQRLKRTKKKNKEQSQEDNIKPKGQR